MPRSRVGRIASPLLCPLFIYVAISPCLIPAQRSAGLPTSPRTGQVGKRAADQSSGTRDEAITTLKVSVRRVALDVTVTDASGKPVADLNTGDFQVFEDNVLQPIRSFHEQHAETSAPVELPNLPVNTFIDLSSAVEGGPPTVILYDLLNTPQGAQPYAREQLLTFLRQQRTHRQMAIFVLTDQLHMLQGFTDNADLLIRALTKPTAKGYRSTFLQGQDEATASSDQISRTEGNQNGADAQPDAAFQQIAGMLQHMQIEETSYLLDRRVDITSEALQGIARFLAGQPGRKNLLWLSGSFPSGVLPDENGSGRDAFNVTRNYSEAIVAATKLLTASHVAVYPVDVHGVQVNPMFSAASNQAFEPDQNKDSRAVRNFATAQASEHGTMDNIAQATGGRAFYNTNGLAQAEQTAEEEGSLYYAITYAPTNTNFDGKLRHVRIQTTRPGLRLSYAHSYFADDRGSAAQNDADSSADTLAAALQHGAPLAHDVFFEAHVETAGAPVQATEGQVEDLLKYEAMKAASKRKGLVDRSKPVMLQGYNIQIALIPRQLAIRIGLDQLRRDDLEFAVMAFDADGLTLNGVRTKLQDVIHADRWSLMQQDGYHIPLALLVPVQARFLRIAVRDDVAQHIGTMELSLPLARVPLLSPTPLPASESPSP